jgi:hypothetical protein
MIQTENLTINGRGFVKTYSDEGFYIQKVGTDEVYSEAIDVENSGYTYEETDTPIEMDMGDDINEPIE